MFSEIIEKAAKLKAARLGRRAEDGDAEESRVREEEGGPAKKSRTP